jgi:hypothetical protein
MRSFRDDGGLDFEQKSMYGSVPGNAPSVVFVIQNAAANDDPPHKCFSRPEREGTTATFFVPSSKSASILHYSCCKFGFDSNLHL